MDKKLHELIEELEETKEMYKTLSRVSPVGIFRTDENSKCVYVNEKWREFAGMTMEEAQGDNWINAIHPEDRQHVSEALQVCNDNDSDLSVECRMMRPDGKITWVLAQASCINGGGKGHVGTVTDITGKKEFLPQLMEIRAAKKCRSV